MSLLTWSLVPLISIYIAFYLIYYSCPYFSIIDVVSYERPPRIPFIGPFTPNGKLLNVTQLGFGKLEGPEAIAFDAEGNIYTGCADGNIYKIDEKRDTVELYASVGGRPLGLAFDKNNNLIICEVMKGLISVDPVHRQTTILASQAGGSPIFYCDDVEISQKTGKIYFSDATNIGGTQIGNRWDIFAAAVVSMISSDPTGRLIEYDPETRTTTVLLEGLVFANGVSLSKNEDFILVAETGKPQIRRYYLSGNKAGTSDFFVKNSPGLNDGINTTPDGRFIVSIFSTDFPLEFLLPHPFLKKIAISLLPFLNSTPREIGLVVIYDEDGNMVESLWDQKGEKIKAVTTTYEREGKLYLGSFVTPAISVYQKRK